MINSESVIAVFFDRDGVLFVETPRGTYALTLDDCKIKDGAREAVQAALDAGYMVFVATNQAAVAKGLLDIEVLEQMHEKMHEAIPDIKKVYVCIHAKDARCKCRKPMPGMVLQAAEEFGIDLVNSIFVGDSNTDIEAGQNAGIGTTIFVRHNHNADELQKCTPSHVVGSMREVAQILQQR